MQTPSAAGHSLTSVLQAAGVSSHLLQPQDTGASWRNNADNVDTDFRQPAGMLYAYSIRSPYTNDEVFTFHLTAF